MLEPDSALDCRFDKVRIPRENLLNAVADVTPDGRYESAIKDPDQVCVVKFDCLSNSNAYIRPLLLSIAATILFVMVNFGHPYDEIINSQGATYDT